MKTYKYNFSGLLIILVVTILIVSCDSDKEYSIDPGSGPFSIKIMNPTAMSFVADTVHVATTETGNRRLALVEFYVDGELRKKDFFAPYGFDWLTGGYTQSSEHTIKAIAYEFGGFFLDSAVTIAIVDNVAPSVVSDLSGDEPTLFTANLNWTAPGNDGDSGNATFYDVRYRLSPINEQNWITSTEVSGEPIPGVKGASESMLVTDLSPKTTYYFAVRAADTVYNWSEVSNNIIVTTPPLFDAPVMIGPLPGGNEARYLAPKLNTPALAADIVMANLTSGTVSVMAGDNLGGLVQVADLNVGISPFSVEIGDLNYDSFADLLIADIASDGVSILYGKAGGNFDFPKAYYTGNGASSAIMGDFDGVGELDIAVVNLFSNNVVILRPLNNGDYSRSGSIQVDQFPSSIISGDWDKDGKIDLAVVCRNENSINILFGDGTGEFRNSAKYMTGLQPVDLTTSDLNYDGNTDLISADYGSNAVSVFYGNNDGTFQAARTIPVSQGPVNLVVIDIDNDGDFDLLTANANNATVSLAMGDGDGFFRAATTYYTGGLPTSLVVLDFDNDNDLDLIVAHEYGTTLSLLLNNSNI